MKTVIGVLVFANASAAQASNWVQIGQVESKPVYMDTIGVSASGTEITAWEKFAESDGGYTLQRVLFECSNYTLTVQTQVRYNAKGVLLLSTTDDGYMYKWAPVVPDSIGETAINIVCKRSK